MNILKVARAKLGISQQKMAEKLEISRQQVVNYESKKQKPTLERVYALALAYKITAQEVLLHFEEKDKED